MTCNTSFDWSTTSAIVDAGGNFWFTQFLNYSGGQSRIVKISSSGIISQTYAPGGARHWEDLTVGPDGNLWVSDSTPSSYKVSKLIISSAGLVTGVSNYPVLAKPRAITIGSDGNLWLTLGSYAIAKMTTAGAVSSYATSTGTSLTDITAGSDGALWFTKTHPTGTNYVGRATTNGAITEYAVPSSGAEVYGITAGPDGALWFTEYAGKKIGRLGY